MRLSPIGNLASPTRDISQADDIHKSLPGVPHAILLYKSWTSEAFHSHAFLLSTFTGHISGSNLALVKGDE